MCGCAGGWLVGWLVGWLKITVFLLWGNDWESDRFNDYYCWWLFRLRTILGTFLVPPIDRRHAPRHRRHEMKVKEKKKTHFSFLSFFSFFIIVVAIIFLFYSPSYSVGISFETRRSICLPSFRTVSLERGRFFFIQWNKWFLPSLLFFFLVANKFYCRNETF